MTSRIICLLAMLAASACGSPGTAKTRLSIATGGTGGVFYPYGGGIAKVITEHIPNVEATAEVTAASVDNLKFLRDRKADLAFTTADTLADAVNGHDAFEGTKLPLRALAVLYVNYTQVVTLASSPIKTLADLKGKVVSTGSPGSGGEVTAFRILEAVGINPATDIHEAKPRRRAGGRCPERRQDRCVLLERRTADRGHSRSCAHARHHDSIAAQRRCASGAAANLRSFALLPAERSEGHLPGP